MIWVLDGDELLSEEDLKRLQLVADAAGGRMHRASSFQEHRDVPDLVRMPRHVRGALAARNLLPTEVEFLRSVFPDAPPTHQRIRAGRDALPAELLARLPAGSVAGSLLDERLASRLGDDPELVAWSVLSGMDDEQASFMLEYQSGLVRGWRSVQSREAVSQRLSMDDPAGSMPLSPMLTLASQLAHHDRLAAPMTVSELTQLVAGCGAAHVEQLVWKPELTTATGTQFVMTVDLRKQLWNPISREGALSPADAARQTLRLLFKAAGYPERVVTRPDGTLGLEVLEQGRWLAVDPGLVIEPRAG
jgi:hypothetical protein